MVDYCNSKFKLTITMPSYGGPQNVLSQNIFMCHSQRLLYRPKQNNTSTTPSCGGPLRAKIFQKVCLYEQKYDIWPIRTRFDPFKGTPKFIFLIYIFSNIRFLSFIDKLSPLVKNAVSMVKSVTFDSLEPLLPFSKAHPP